MGYALDKAGFSEVVKDLGRNYRIFAPVRKVGEGRFTDTDVIRYEFVTDASEIELQKKSDYSFKEILTPLSETLFFFTEKCREGGRPRYKGCNCFSSQLRYARG